jgi:hypothetical protein
MEAAMRTINQILIERIRYGIAARKAMILGVVATIWVI